MKNTVDKSSSSLSSVQNENGKGVLLKAMKLVVAIVSIGWFFMFIMLPTNTYRNVWSPKLLSSTDSTYFGEQGMYMLIYTFPGLFISVLGCFYLHMVKQRDNVKNDKLIRRLEEWKRPAITKGPLGVVSTMELSFWLLFLALLVWSLSMYLVTGFSRITPETAAAQGRTMWQAKLSSTGLRLGLVGNIACAFLFFPVTRTSSLLPLIGLTSESSIKYHVWIGHIVMVLFTGHGICYFILWGSTHKLSQILMWGTHHVSNVAGEIALLCGLIMWATTFSRIRRKMFELFFYAHQLYVLFLVFYLLHIGISAFCLILPGIYLFIVDRYLRFLQSRQNVRLLSARLLPSETIELTFSKIPGFGYTPTSIVFINVPGVSMLQWHPFTISSSNNLEPEKLSVVIKKEGSWTKKLYRTLDQPSLDNLDVVVEGPYGPASVDFTRHDSLAMVSGGSGLAPFISIIRELIYRTTVIGSPSPSVLLICSFKTSADLTMLDLLLPIATSTVSDLSKLQLKIEAFVTRENAPTTTDDNKGKLIRTLCFKPRSSDLPVAPVLCPNGWLWLALIISSSFVTYLLLIGIVTRYYIYPIEKSGSMYSATWRALWNLLFVCVGIAAACSGVVLGYRRRSRAEANRVQVLDAPTPSSSPSSWFFKGERELESVPQEALVQATTVHYGRRADLKKMLLEIEESSVGVMASGPSELRHEVAAICASGLAHSLHYESISFSW